MSQSLKSSVPQHEMSKAALGSVQLIIYRFSSSPPLPSSRGSRIESICETGEAIVEEKETKATMAEYSKERRSIMLRVIKDLKER